MKKLIVSLVLMSFVVAVQAGDSKTCTAKDKAACSAITKTSTGDSGCCAMAKGTTCKSAQTKVLMSPKGAEQAPRMLVASR